jgi:hypothetical protein
MQRLCVRPGRLWWPLIVALALILMPAGKAHAQFMGYGGYGFGYPGWGYGGWGWGGYGYPGGYYNYGYPFYGMGNFPVYGNFNMGYAGFGYGGYGGYGGFGGYGLGYGGYMPGGIGVSGVGYFNPMFGVGLTPLGTQSFFVESKLFGRVPRASGRYYGVPYRGW